MKVDYFENNQTEISEVLEGGGKELEISFFADGLLKDLPSKFIIPRSICDEYNKSTKFFLNVDYDKQPPEWVIDEGERPS